MTVQDQIDALRKRRATLLDTESRAQKLELLGIDGLQVKRGALVDGLEYQIDQITKKIQDLQPTPDKDVLGKMVDVSGAQGSVDWGKMAADGVKVATCKTTEGQTFNDPYWSGSRLDAIVKAGLAPGVYHFARPDNNSGAAEADAFVSRVKNTGGKFIGWQAWKSGESGIYGWLDFEHTPYSAQFAVDFSKKFQALTGVGLGIYGGGYSLNPIAGVIPANFQKVWVAAYANSFQPYLADSLESMVVFWQYTSSASLGGESPLDVSHYLG